MRSAAEAKPVNSPHPFRGAGRDETIVEFFRVFKLDGPRLRRRPPPKNITKLKKKHVYKKTRFFIKNNPKVSLKVDPKIVKMVSRRLFCVTEKTLNSTSFFFLPFAVSGTPGPSQIVQFPCKYHHFRDATLSQK